MTTNEINTVTLNPGKEMDGGSIIRIKSANNGIGMRFGIGCVTRGDSARQVTAGPLVPGPWAYAYGLGVCIDNHGGTGAESRRLTASGQEVELEIGDHVIIDSVEYEIDYYRSGSWVDRRNIVLNMVRDLVKLPQSIVYEWTWNRDDEDAPVVKWVDNDPATDTGLARVTSIKLTIFPSSPHEIDQDIHGWKLTKDGALDRRCSTSVLCWSGQLDDLITRLYADAKAFHKGA